MTAAAERIVVVLSSYHRLNILHSLHSVCKTCIHGSHGCKRSMYTRVPSFTSQDARACRAMQKYIHHHRSHLQRGITPSDPPQTKNLEAQQKHKPRAFPHCLHASPPPPFSNQGFKPSLQRNMSIASSFSGPRKLSVTHPVTNLQKVEVSLLRPAPRTLAPYNHGQ